MSMKNRTSTDWLVVHCSASTPTMDIGKVEIDRWHRAQGWLMIGYHFVIRRDGKVETGRPELAIGSHVAGYNSNSIGICLVGGVDAKGKSEDNYTSAQYEALALLLRELKGRYPKAQVQGHRDFPKVAKDCPCFDVRDWINETGVFEEKVAAPAVCAPTTIHNTWAYHTIVAGETLWALAKKYQTKVEVITALNPTVKVNSLKVGATIRVR
jgi:LysM repeat protein